MLELYGDRRSANTRKVLWLLEELGLPFEFRSVLLMDGQHKKPEYLRINPNGKVPALVDDGFTLWESDAILRYVAASRGSLFPQDPRQRAQVEQWMSWNTCHLSRVTLDARAMRMVALRLGTPLDEKRHADIVAGAPPLLKILDDHLAGTEYVAGPSLTIADLALAMNVASGTEEGLSLGAFPNVTRWHGTLTSRPAYRKVNA